MTQSGNGKPRSEQLPYYQQYVEQILRPRVMQLLDDVRERLAEHAWQDLLIHVAHDQGDQQPDAESLGRLRAMLESSLGLEIKVQVSIECAEPGTGGKAAGGANSSGTPVQARRIDGDRDNVDVVDRSFPDNPLARAVGSMRRVDR